MVVLTFRIDKQMPEKKYFQQKFLLFKCHWTAGIPFGGKPLSLLHRFLGSLSTHVFETRTATGRERFACQDSGVSQIFILIFSNRETILSNVNVVV